MGLKRQKWKTWAKREKEQQNWRITGNNSATRTGAGT
jgi:hypothetical protein